LALKHLLESVAKELRVGSLQTLDV